MHISNDNGQITLVMTKMELNDFKIYYAAKSEHIERDVCRDVYIYHFSDDECKNYPALQGKMRNAFRMYDTPAAQRGMMEYFRNYVPRAFGINPLHDYSYYDKTFQELAETMRKRENEQI